MQMIDVMKRLAELDAQNPNIVKESSQSVEECGMGALGGMSQPHTPASINMTAASGEELSSMLKDIMTLAGKNDPMSDEPVKGADGIATVDMDMKDEPSVMRSMLDKLNPEDEKPVEEYDNSPDPEMMSMPSGNQDPAGTPGAADGRNLKNHPVATPETTYESLMAEYRKFISEDEQGVAEGSQLVPGKFYVVGDGDRAVAGPFDDQGEAEGEQAEYSQGGRRNAAVAQWAGNNWNFDYMMEQGVAEGSDSDLRDSILNNVLLTIYHGAKNGQDMTDTIADELGDYFDEVDNSNDIELKKIYAYVRNLADQDSDIQASGVLKAIKKLKGANYIPPKPEEVPDDDPMVRDLTGAFSAGMASKGIKSHPDWDKKEGMAEQSDILKLAGLK